jgi:hypothetical protein
MDGAHPVMPTTGSSPVAGSALLRNWSRCIRVNGNSIAAVTARRQVQSLR